MPKNTGKSIEKFMWNPAKSLATECWNSCYWQRNSVNGSTIGNAGIQAIGSDARKDDFAPGEQAAR